MDKYTQIKQHIEEYKRDLNLELEAQEYWFKNAEEKYKSDVNFFGREGCDDGEVCAARDCVSRVSLQIRTVEDILKMFK